MTNNDRHLYWKHNNFVAFRGHAADDSGSTVVKISVALDGPNNSKQLTTHFMKIFENVKTDLFTIGGLDRPRFGLTPHVAKEINWLTERDIARYLAHRYRDRFHPHSHAKTAMRN